MDEYELHPAFERVVAFLAASNGRFYTTVGKHVNPGALAIPQAIHVFESCHAIFKSTGAPPGSIYPVLQWHHALHIDGKRTLAELHAIEKMLIEAEDAGPQDHEAVAAQLIPVLQRVAGRAVTADAIRATDGSSFAALSKQFGRVAEIGLVDTDYGYKFRADDFSQIDELGQGDRLSFGIPELDAITNQGLKRGHACLVVAPSAGGKTTFLCQILREGWTRGLSVAYATLELAVGEIDAKIRSGMTNIAQNRIITDVRSRNRCAQRIRETPGLGGLMIKKFPARKTTWPQLVEWFESLAEPEALGELPHVFLIDFLGKLGWSNSKLSRYEAQGEIMDNMHDYAEENGLWLGTASQPQRGKKDRKIIDLDDVNDSQGKVEGSDIMISLNPREDGIYYWVAKHRAGPSSIGVGPFPHDFEYGRMAQSPELEDLGVGSDGYQTEFAP